VTAESRRLKARDLFAWLDVHHLATVILFVAIFAMAVRAPVDTDTWWHLQAGRQTLESGRILQTDLFSHTRYGTRWVNHSWLSQVILFWLFESLSYAGLGLWIGMVVTAAFALVFLQMEGGVFTRAFIIILAAATSAVVWTARPQLLSFLLTAAVGYVLYLFKWRGSNRLWLVPPLFVLWVNLHAGYALGFLVLAAFLAGEVLNHILAAAGEPQERTVSWRGIALVAAVSLLSALLLVVNPNTTRMWTYYLDTVGIGALRDFIQEWQSPDFHPLHTQPFIWLLLLTLAAFGLSRRRVDGTDLAYVALFAYASLLAGRNLAPFALVAAPALSRHVAVIIDRWREGLSGSSGRGARAVKPPAWMLAANWGLLLLVIVAALVKVYVPLEPGFNEALERERLPAAAVDWIGEHKPAGQMLNHYNWGGYIIWRLWPEYRVFVDGRTDLFGDDILSDYVEIQRGGPDSLYLLEQYDISFVLTDARDSLSALLDCEQGWGLAYEDELAAVWVSTGQTP
jgi:hypothetical protein